MKRRILPIGLVIVLTGLFVTNPVNAQFKELQLIENETVVRQDITTTLHFFENKDAVTRFREVELNVNLKSLFTVEPEDHIHLNLFSDVEYITEVQRVEEIMDGNVTITAKLLSFDYAFMVIATTEDRTLTTILIPEKGVNYQIISDPITLNHFLLEINPALLPEPTEYPSLTPGELTEEDIQEQERIQKEIDNTKSGPNDPATIDVMIIYTPAARTWGNSNGGILNLIATSVAIGKTALSNSSTIATTRLVHTGEISYTEYTGPAIWYGSPYNFWASGPEVDLIRLTDGTHGFATAHTWRNTYGADLVQLFTTMGGGIAWVLGNTGGSPDWGFSLAGVSTATAYTPIHEMGHNMGCGHHKDQNFQAGPALYTYSAGWRWQGTDNVWYSSVMSYTGSGFFPSNPVNSIRVGHFSNPSVNYMGVATGDAVDGDNARTIRNTKHVIAAYRSTATINCFDCPAYNIAMAPNQNWNTHSASIVSYGCYMYRVNVTAGHTYTFQTGCGNGATANFDTYLTLYDSNCLIEATDDDGCGYPLSKIEWMADYTGYAYLKVSGWSSAYGNFTLAFHRGDDIAWTGQYSTNWNYAGNWSGNVVPDNTFDVSIPFGTPYTPNIYLANAECKSLTVEAGAILNMGAYNLVVSNDVNIHGTLNQNSTSSKLYVYGNIYWQSGSSATATASATIYVQGIWEFMNGANVYLTSGYVDFFGSGVSYIRSKDADSHFNHLKNNKTGNQLGHSAQSTQPCRLNGNLYIYSNCKLTSYTSQSFRIGNFVNNISGIIELNNGTFVFDGTSGTSHFMPGDYFNNVTISSSGTTTFDDNIEIRGNLLIESGVLSLGSTTLTINGNWTNSVGTSAFAEGSSRVAFAGAGHQYIYSNETFNILEAAMGAALRINNASHTVTCNQYDWTSGGIDVIAGTFTAIDLVQNGIYGGYWLNPGGTINLTNNDGYVDLNGDLNILGGNFNVFGGTSNSYWPFAANASINMSGGVLDFKDRGINIYNSATYTLTENITGGTIRTSRGFSGNRADFTPNAGTFEFYGSSDYSISQSNDCTLHDVVINKSTKEGGGDHISGQVYDERSGELLTDGSKANTITLGSNFTTTGNLNINAGTFNLGSYSCYVGGNTNIYGTLTMTNAANNLSSYGIYWQSGSNDNVTAGNFYADDWRFFEGTNAKLGTGNTAYLTNMSYPTDDDAEFGNLVAGPYARIYAGENGSKAYYPVRVSGNFALQNTYWSFHLSGVDVIVQGNADIQNGSTLSFSAATDFIVNGTLSLAGTLNLGIGSVAAVEGELTFPSTGWLSLNQATFTNNFAVSAYTYLYGKLTMNDNSILEFPGRSIYIGNSFINEVSGGTLRFGRTLNAPGAGNYQLDFGTVEFFSAYSNHFIAVHNGNYLNDVVIDKTSVSLMLSQDLVVNKDMVINSGVLYASDKTISIGGDWTNNGGTSAFNAGTGQVIFNGTGTLNHQFVNGNTNFYDVENAKSGDGYLRFVGNNAITNDFLANGENIVDGPTLDVNNLLLSTGVMGLTAAAPSVTVNNFTMGGYLSVTNGNFICTDITNNGIYGNIHLYNGEVVLNQIGDDYTDLNGDLTIEGGNMTVNGTNEYSIWGWSAPASLTMTSGTLNFDNPGIAITSIHPVAASISGGTIRTSGTFWVTHPNFVPTGGTAELYGNDPVWIQSSGGSHFYNLIIDKSASLLLGGDNTTDREYFGVDLNNRLERDRITFEPPAGRSGNQAWTNGNLKVVNNTVIDEGSLNIVHEATNSGNFTVNSSGALLLENLGSLAMGSGKALTINNGGALALQGNISDLSKITHISGNYGLHIESGANIAAEYAIFEYMNADGVNIKPGAIVDHSKAFHNCTFRLGQSSGRLLTINNSQTFAVNYASFPYNSWGGNNNVSKTVNSGVVTFMGYSGDYAGATYEQDPNSRIHWGGQTAAIVALEGVEVVPGQDICFEATNTLTVGGGGSSFEVQNGGFVELVAGQKIEMLEGTHFHNGSYGLARITTTADYCSLPAPLIAANEETLTTVGEALETVTGQLFFRLYPNPTTGIMMLEFSEVASGIMVEVFGMTGEQILKQEVHGYQLYKFDLANYPKGIYIVRVTTGVETGMIKLIKQ
jgi:hypothetical protein